MVDETQDTSAGESQAGTADASATGRTYTESEVEARLRGQAKEIERLRKASDELDKLRAERSGAAVKAAEERGEYQRLYEDRQRQIDEIQAERDKLVEKHSIVEDLLRSEVELTVKAIEDQAHRERVKALLDGRDVLDQRAILATFAAAAIPQQQAAMALRAPRVPTGGAPGTPGRAQIDETRFATDPAYRRQVISDAVRAQRG